VEQVMRITKLWRKHPIQAGGDASALSRAIESWRREAPAAERLSGPGRQRLAAAVRGAATPPRHLTSLFVPGARLALAGGIPVVLLTVLVGALGIPRKSHDGATSSGLVARVDAHKVGADVVFVIANGQRSHQVYKSNDPKDFGPDARFVETQGTFRDRLANGGSDVVFYRIE
jgi:hypothetical protein